MDCNVGKRTGKNFGSKKLLIIFIVIYWATKENGERESTANKS
jgi:hypothetical protein